MKTMMMAGLLVWCVFAVAGSAYDEEDNHAVSINQNQPVQPYQQVEVFDYQTGQSHRVQVNQVQQQFGQQQVQTFDYTTGKYETYHVNGR